MLKYQKLIESLSLEQKLKLVTSCEKFRTNAIGDLEIPSLVFEEIDMNSFNYGSVEGLMTSWNHNLIKAKGGYIALSDTENPKIFAINPNYAEANNDVKNSFVDDLEKGLLSYAYTLTDKHKAIPTKLTFVLRNKIDPDIMNNNTLYVASSYDDAKAAINAGALITFLDSEEDFSLLLEALKRYRTLALANTKGTLSDEDFLYEKASSNILNEDLINTRISYLLDVILAVKNKHNYLVKNKLSDFDLERSLGLHFYDVSREALVLLKNEILPFEKSYNSLAIMSYLPGGDDLKLSEYLLGLAKEKRLDPVGFLALDLNSNDIPDAVELASKAEYSLLIISEKTASLPNYFNTLSKEIKNTGSKLIALVVGKSVRSINVDDVADSVFYTPNVERKTFLCLFEALIGENNPSGGLINEIEGVVKYPLGYGLSYSTPRFKDLRMLKDHLEVACYNASDYNSLVRCYLFDEKNNLLGFSKTFVRARCYEMVSIELAPEYIKGIEVGKEYSYSLRCDYEKTIASFKATPVKLPVLPKAKKTKLSDPKIKDNQKKHKRALAWVLLFMIIYFTAVGVINYLTSKEIGLGNYIFFGFVGVFDLVAFIAMIKLFKYKELNSINTDNLFNSYKLANVLSIETYEKPVVEEIKVEDFVPEEPEPEPETTEVLEEITEEENSYSYVYERSEKAKSALSFSFDLIADTLATNAKASGILLQRSQANELVAAIASDRIIFINTNDVELNSSLNRTIAKSFGNTYHSISLLDNDDYFFSRNEEGILAYNDFGKAIVEANEDPENMYFCFIEGISEGSLNKLLSPFARAINTLSDEVKLALNEELTVYIPRNLWIIVEDNKIKPNMYVSKTSALVDLKLQPHDSSLELEGEGSLVSLELFNQAIKEIRQSYYLAEEFYKKLDEFYEIMADVEGVTESNKNFLRFEAFTSVLKSLEVEDNECLDALFAAKIVPMVRNFKLLNEDKGLAVLKEAFTKAFGEGNLAVSEKKLFG